MYGNVMNVTVHSKEGGFRGLVLSLWSMITPRRKVWGGCLLDWGGGGWNAYVDAGLEGRWWIVWVGVWGGVFRRCPCCCYLYCYFLRSLSTASFCCPFLLSLSTVRSPAPSLPAALSTHPFLPTPPLLSSLQFSPLSPSSSSSLPISQIQSTEWPPPISPESTSPSICSRRKVAKKKENELHLCLQTEKETYRENGKKDIHASFIH